MGDDANTPNIAIPPAAYERERIGEAPRRGPGRRGFDPEVRERVIAAAQSFMDEKGLDAVKARAIARETGIAVGSVYNLFGDLDELVRIVNGRTYDELYAIETAALEAARAVGEDPRRQMLALARAYLEFVAARQRRWQATLAFNRAQTAPPPRWYMEKELALFRIIEDAIAAFPGARDPARRRLTARALWASIHGIVTIAVADGFLMQPIDDVWEEIRIIVNAVAASLEK